MNNFGGYGGGWGYGGAMMGWPSYGGGNPGFPGAPGGPGSMPGMGMPPVTTSPFDVGGAVKGVGSALMGGVKGIGNWAQQNPQLASDILGTAMSAYGAYKQGKANDQALEIQRQRQALEEKKYADALALDQQERERRRRAYQEILAAREQRNNGGG